MSELGVGALIRGIEQGVRYMVDALIAHTGALVAVFMIVAVVLTVAHGISMRRYYDDRR